MSRFPFRRGIQRLGVVALAAGAAAIAIHGCGGGGHHGGGGSTGGGDVDLGVPTGVRGTTSFQQDVAPSGAQQSGSLEAFPGQANQWDLDGDLSVDDGGDDQFDGAMTLDVNGVAAGSYAYGDLTWSTPFLDTGDGVVAAGVTTTAFSPAAPATPPEGTHMCALAGLAQGVALRQQIDLTGVTTGAVLSWVAITDPLTSAVPNITDTDQFFRVILRTPAGASLTGDISGQSAGFPLSGTLTSQPVVISFETKYTQVNNDDVFTDLGTVFVDAVSVTHSAGTQVVTNGGFETGDLSGWTATLLGQHLQNVHATETIGSVRLTRSFFARPDRLWGRWTDLFENLSGAAISVTADYNVNYGSDTGGVKYFTPNTSSEAVTAWDAAGEDRDAGIFLGSGAAAVTFTSATTLGGSDGTTDLSWTHTFTLQPGAKATLVHFAVLNGVNTGASATTITAQATSIDSELLRIHQDLHTAEFGEGMTEDELSNVLND